MSASSTSHETNDAEAEKPCPPVIDPASAAATTASTSETMAATFKKDNTGMEASVSQLQNGDSKHDQTTVISPEQNNVTPEGSHEQKYDDVMAKSIQENGDSALNESTPHVYDHLVTPCPPKPDPVMKDLSRETKDKLKIDYNGAGQLRDGKKGEPEDLSQWEIVRNTLEFPFEKPFSEGRFGKVWKGKYLGTRAVAIKTLKPETMTPAKFLEEAMIMKKCQHDKLVRLYAVCTKEEPIYIVTELMAHGSLLEYMRKGDGKYLEIPSLLYIAAQIASGMSYLGRNNYIHRDLAARNVLVDDHNIVKVADFGLAKVIEDGECDLLPDFPVRWTAPEAWRGKFTIKSDVWSYGILLHELMTKGKIPYRGMSNAEVKVEVDGGYRMQKEPDTPDPVYEKMLECWDKDPENRPTFEVLFTFFDDYYIPTKHNYSDSD